MSTKRIFTIAAIIAGTLAFFSFKKYKQAKEVIDNLKISIKKIQNIKFGFPTTRFDAVISIFNPTNIDFGATLASRVVITQIQVFTSDNILIGKANTNIFEVQLPANTTIDLQPITFNVDVKKAFGEFFSNTTSFLQNDFSSLKYKIDVQVFGKNLTLEA